MGVSGAIVDRVLELCRKEGITVNKLATLSGVTQSTVNEIVNGVSKNFGVVTLKKLCDGLGITLTEFFDTDVFRNLEQEIR